MPSTLMNAFGSATHLPPLHWSGAAAGQPLAMGHAFEVAEQEQALALVAQDPSSQVKGRKMVLAHASKNISAHESWHAPLLHMISAPQVRVSPPDGQSEASSAHSPSAQ
jgi:hypothetical protein